MRTNGERNNNTLGGDQDGLIDSWCTFTIGHGYENVLKDYPDAIVRRKELFSLYTRHLYQLLSMINKVEGSKESIVCDKIDKIVKWASDKDLKDARFDGIFAFEIMCLNEKIDPKNAHGKQVLVPVKYLGENGALPFTRNGSIHPVLSRKLV